MSRNLIKYGGIGLVVFLFLWTGMTAAIKAYKAAHPPYTPPDMRFGILPKLVFPEKTFEKKEFTKALPGDVFPKFSDQAKVYVVYLPKTLYGSLDYAKSIAKDLGFAGEPTETKTGSGIYEFKSENLNQVLRMNVLDGSFVLKYPYESDQMLLSPDKMPMKEGAIDIARAYLAKANKLPKDIEGGEKKVSFWKIEFDGLKLVESLSEANMIRVDFFRETTDNKLKLMTSEPGKAAISVLVSGSSVEGKKVVEINYRYVDIDRQSFSSYPIKTVETAFNDLKAGNYWPASDNQSGSAKIKNVYLAYFEPVNLTNYLQPVFVFEGDNQFVGYVSAILDKYVKQN